MMATMSGYQGLLRIEGEEDPPLAVEIDLADGRMRIAAGQVEVADWSLDEVRISALIDGFHVRSGVEEIVLDVTDDAHFALDLGLRTAHPHLRQKMSALMRDDA